MNISKIDYLIDELGKIDDRFINEALSVEAPTNSRRKISKALALVAAVVAVLMLSLSLIANLGDKSFDSVGDDYEENMHQEQSDKLYQDLTSLDASSLAAIEVEGEVNELLYDKTPRLIWTFGDGVYYSVTLRNTADEHIIEDYLKNDRYTKADPDDQFANFRFFITYGNGKCTTPYLENNGGRDSYGSLSDYLPEIYPSDAFANFISELILDQIQTGGRL